MDAHPIRLRKGWTLRRGAASRPIDLPAARGSDLGAPCTLERRFGRPPGDHAVALRLADVGGLCAAWLNGQGLPLPADAGRSGATIDLGGRLAARNVLTLAVDLAGEPPEALERPWGDVALVLRPR